MMHSKKYQLTHVVPLARHRAQNGVSRQTRALRWCGNIEMLQD
jgi:hypothetical protein